MVTPVSIAVESNLSLLVSSELSDMMPVTEQKTPDQAMAAAVGWGLGGGRGVDEGRSSRHA